MTALDAIENIFLIKKIPAPHIPKILRNREHDTVIII